MAQAAHAYVTRDELDRDMDHMREVTDAKFQSVERALTGIQAQLVRVQTAIDGMSKDVTRIDTEAKGFRRSAAAGFALFQLLLSAGLAWWLRR